MAEWVKNGQYVTHVNFQSRVGESVLSSYPLPYEKGWGNPGWLHSISPTVKHQEEPKRQPGPINSPKEEGKELERNDWEEMAKWK